MADAVDGDNLSRLCEEDAVVADTEAQKADELAREGFDVARASLGVAVNSLENRQGDLLRDGPNLSGDFGVNANLLHGSCFAERTCSVVKPRSATTSPKLKPLSFGHISKKRDAKRKNKNRILRRVKQV